MTLELHWWTYIALAGLAFLSWCIGAFMGLTEGVVVRLMLRALRARRVRRASPSELELLDEMVVEAEADASVDRTPPSPPEYQGHLEDWGPTFTGEDGTLPRWRWAVSADGRVLMLGNEYDRDLAVEAAVSWLVMEGHVGETLWLEEVAMAVSTDRWGNSSPKRTVVRTRRLIQ